MSENIVLLVDDNGNIVNSFKRSTHRESFKVLTARSGFEALNILKNNGVSMVITDENMPVMKGSELIMKISEEYPHIMVILFTGHLESADMAKVMNSGNLFKVLRKPISLEEILVHVNKGLELKEAFKAYRDEHDRVYATP